MLLGERKTEDAFDEEGSSKENIKAVFVHNIEDPEAALRRRIKTAHIVKMDRMSSWKRSTFHQAEMVVSKQKELRI